MSEQPPARKRYRSDDSSDEELSKKAKFHASTSGLQSGTHLQLSIDEGIRQLCAYQSDLRRGCVASKGSILAVLDAMRAEIIGSSTSDSEGHTVTAWIGNREYGGSLYDTPLLTSDVSEHGERRAIIASGLCHYKDHMTDVLAKMCRNANVLIYKITGVALSEAWMDLRETWPKFVPANADRMTVSELVLDGCTVETPRDGSISREMIVMRMLERFRRVHGVRLIIRLKSYGRAEDDWDCGFTDRFLEFSAAHEIGSVNLCNWDKGISEKGVINFLLNAPSDRCKRELHFCGDRGVTARFYDALVKASTECATAHAASLRVSDCDPDSLPQGQVRDADEESEGAWGDTEYRFFRGLLPFNITGESSCSGTFISYERGDAVGRDEHEGGDDEPAQDDYDEEERDANDEEERDGNHVEADDLDLVDEC